MRAVSQYKHEMRGSAFWSLRRQASRTRFRVSLRRGFSRQPLLWRKFVVKVTVEQASDSEAVLSVELEWDELEKASERAYKKLAQQDNVPGFRRGKAPRSD